MQRARRYYGPVILICYMTVLLATASSIITSNLFILQNIASIAPSVSAQQNRAKLAEEIHAFRRERLEKLKPLFEQHSIPFSPEVFVTDDWRRRLAPILESMPEMKMTRTTGKYLSGVYIANALILPEKVETGGDTFILANHLIFEGLDAGIQPVGEGSLHVYLIKSDNVRRIRIEPASDSIEEQTDGVNRYVEWVLQKDSHLPTERELLLAIDLPKNAKNIRIIGSYVYFQLSSVETVDK